MFLNDVNINSKKIPEIEFEYIVNFLDKLPEALSLITNELVFNTLDLFAENNFYYNNHTNKLKEIIGDQFKLLINAKRDFKFKILYHFDELLNSLNENGLTGESLMVKFELLDLLWVKSKNLINDLRGGLHFNLINAMLNLFKALLNSILNAIGFNLDIFNEAFSILNSLTALSNNEYQQA